MIKFDYFTSDTHFGSERALTLSKRPFTNVMEMDGTIIENFNSQLKEISYLPKILHLGDFGNYAMINKINADIYLLMGNYEEKEMNDNFNGDFFKYRNHLIDLGFSDVYRDVMNLQKDNFVTGGELENIPSIVKAVHEPMKLKPYIEKNGVKQAFALFGHIHGRQKCKKFGLDAGVDAHNFNLISANDIEFYFQAINKFYDENVFM